MITESLQGPFGSSRAGFKSTVLLPTLHGTIPTDPQTKAVPRQVMSKRSAAPIDVKTS